MLRIYKTYITEQKGKKKKDIFNLTWSLSTVLAGFVGSLFCLPRIRWPSMTSRCICQSPACYCINKSTENIRLKGERTADEKPICIHIIPAMSFLRQIKHDMFRNICLESFPPDFAKVKLHYKGGLCAF